MTFVAYSDLDKIEGTKKAEQLDSCRRHAWFVRHKQTGQVRVVSNACRLRWCPLCSRAHQNLIEHNVHEWLKSAKHPKFLTLTLKHSEAPLHQQIENLYKFFLRFRRLKEIRGKITGGVWFFQIKKSTTDNYWHPHLHCIIDGQYISHALLSRLWLRTTLTSFVVDIKAVKDDEKIAEYVARYCARPSPLKHLGQFDCLELINSLHGRRLCGTWGTGKTVKLTMISDPDKENWQAIGAWNLVINSLNQFENARYIFNAWKNGTALGSGCTMYEIDEFIGGYDKYVTAELKKPEPERTFWTESVERKVKEWQNPTKS
jgi:hypothetical protein